MDSQVVVQSFLPQRHTYLFKDAEGRVVPEKGGGLKKAVFPALSASPKNVVIFSVEDWKQIGEDKTTKAMLDLGQRGKGLVILENVPESYWDSKQRVAEVLGKLEAEKAKTADLENMVLAQVEEIDSLKAKLKEYGWKE